MEFVLRSQTDIVECQLLEHYLVADGHGAVGYAEGRGPGDLRIQVYRHVCHFLARVDDPLD